MFENVNKTFFIPNAILMGSILPWIFNFLLSLRQTHYVSRIHGVETVDLSPLPLS
jgi:predicted DNA repair protein MutK